MDSMGIEIERKLLLINSDWQSLFHRRIYVRQGYLSTTPDRTVRIRIWDKQGKLTIKNAPKNGTRLEYEYDIPLQDATEMLNKMCPRPQIEKHRHLVKFGEHLWEVDVFLGSNLGLVVAEVELTDPDEEFCLPPWVGQEITTDHRYSNSQLSLLPYLQWPR